MLAMTTIVSDVHLALRVAVHRVQTDTWFASLGSFSCYSAVQLGVVFRSYCLTFISTDVKFCQNLTVCVKWRTFR
jgi:hypothetical protein